jgi:hypothetical protein
MALFLLFGISASAQVTTNSGSGLSSTYPSLVDAITALNSATISSPVVITLTADQTAPASGYVITASGSSTNTIVINGGGKTVTAGLQPAGGAYDAIFKLLGADWVTIEDFIMQENPSNTSLGSGLFPNGNTMTEWGVALLYASTTNGAQNCTIQNNTITLKLGYWNWGIYSNSSHSPTEGATEASATGPNGGNHGLKVYGNTIIDVKMGITVVGPTAAEDFLTGIDIGGSDPPKGNTIDFANFGNGANGIGNFVNAQLLQYGTPGIVYSGIFVRNTIGANISNNDLSSKQATVDGVLSGIVVPTFSPLEKSP